MRILNRLGGIELSQAYALHQGDLEEEDRGHRPGAQAVRRGGRRARAGARTGPTKIFDLIEFFGGYGFNKSHTTAYALRRLPDGLPQGALPDRVHGRPALLRDGRRRAREVLRRAHRRLPADGDRGPAARTSTRGSRRSGSPPRGRSTSAWGRSRGSGSRPSRRSSRRGRRGAVHAASTTSSSGCRSGVVSQACVEALIKAGAFDCLGAQAEPVARRPAPRRPGRPGRAGRPQARPARASSTSSTSPTTPRQRQRQRQRQRPRAPLEPARRPRAARRRAAGRGEEGARLLHVEPPADPPRRRAPGAGDPPGRRPGRRPREDRGRSSAG